MTNIIKLEDLESLRKRYLSSIKKITTEDLRYTLSVLYCKPEWIMDNPCFKNLSSKEKNKYRDIWLKLFGFDKPKYNQIIENLKINFGIFADSKNNRIPIPIISLLVDMIKPILILRDEGKEMSDDQRIISIQCFTSENSNNDYKIVINEDYITNPLSVSRTKKIWAMMFELIQNGYLRSDKETKRLYDYFNFNKNNLITTNTKYPLQITIKQEDNIYKPNFKGEVFTEKTLVQRQNKFRKST